MKLRTLTLLLATLLPVSLVSAFAGDVTGTWKAEFDTAIGVQKYTYELKADGEKLTGKAIGLRDGEAAAEVALTEGQIRNDEVSFVEKLSFQGQDLRVEYQGRLTSADEIKFTRKVAEFATEELVAHRVKDAAKK